MKPLTILIWSIVFVLSSQYASLAQCLDRNLCIVHDEQASTQETLAAKEIRRYLYLRTGNLVPIRKTLPSTGPTIAISIDKSLEHEAYQLKTITTNDQKVLHITGGSGVAVLYGAYHFAEILGVRFYLHGDVIPDEKSVNWQIPDLDETGSPLFKTRGIQPFHDFPEGPDWWNEADYKAFFSQMPKMGMNFAAFHCYPEGGVGPEPLVWIGLKEDMDTQGKVNHAYPTHWANTANPKATWGYAQMNTSDFAAGAGLLFAEESYGPKVTRGYRPKPTTLEGSITVFERAANMLRGTYGHAHDLGLRICIGTETPLTIPKEVKERLIVKGMDPTSREAKMALYEGMFSRIARAYPVDYYWLWTPEGWTWSGNNQKQLDATIDDIKIALEALHNIGDPFKLATCGWVLGPESDRAVLDKLLPKEIIVSCINRHVGYTAVDTGYAQVKGRSKWVIPWLEDDPAMISPQLWVGRMRRDAADALWYGCDGLLGIHWRTRILGPNMSALAKAAWDQTGWNPDFGKNLPVPQGKLIDVYNEGKIATFKSPIADTENDVVYQTCRYGVKSYDIKVPNGVYDVTLNFCEPHYNQSDERVFAVKIQSKQRLEHLDVFAKVGQNKALDVTFNQIEVTKESLVIEFTPEVENPFIAGIEIQGKQKASNQFAAGDFSRKINCGGGAFKTYEKDLEAKGVFQDTRPRHFASGDFYRDWAEAEFGPEAAQEIAMIFQRIDGGGVASGRDANIPRPTTWIQGPGGIKVNKIPWSEAQKKHTYVDDMEALRTQIRGIGSLERFDYWLNTFRYNRTMGELACARGQFDKTIETMNKTDDKEAKKTMAREEALPQRIQLARLWERLMNQQLQRVTNTAELGEISNLEQHNRKKLQYLSLHDKLLQDTLGQSLPKTIHPSKGYTGPARLIVPTVQTQLKVGENLDIKVIVLDSQKPQEARIFSRSLGKGTFTSRVLDHINRGVYVAMIPDQKLSEDFEYYIQVTTEAGQILCYPTTAPAINQTVVVLP